MTTLERPAIVLLALVVDSNLIRKSVVSLRSPSSSTGKLTSNADLRLPRTLAASAAVGSIGSAATLVGGPHGQNQKASAGETKEFNKPKDPRSRFSVASVV